MDTSQRVRYKCNEIIHSLWCWLTEESNKFFASVSFFCDKQHIPVPYTSLTDLHTSHHQFHKPSHLQLSRESDNRPIGDPDTSGFGIRPKEWWCVRFRSRCGAVCRGGRSSGGSARADDRPLLPHPHRHPHHHVERLLKKNPGTESELRFTIALVLLCRNGLG